ncbi:DUF1768-domain-containing protein [Aureobasidium pullulans]|nr:DUF1768-domain-containing protein [Aureobasidium pullulans]
MAPSKRNQVTSDDEPVFFYGDKARPYGIFSQWHKCDFTDPKYPDATFDCAEQYMMYGKAQVFDSPHIAAKILSATSPKTQKDLGRKIEGFSDAVWNPARLGVVKRGSYLKFSQNEKLKKVLLETGDRDLVEASPKDRIWGIGYSAAAAKRTSRDRWGQNLLGIALMYARRKIRAEEAEEEQDEEEDIQPDTIKESIEQTADEEAEDRSESPPAIKKPTNKKRKRNSSTAEEVEDKPKPKKTVLKKTTAKRLKPSPLSETLDSDDEDGKHNSITDDEAPEPPKQKKTAPKKTAPKKKLVKKIPSPPLPEKAPESDDEDEDNVNKGLNQVLNMAKGLKAQTSNDNDDKEEESPAVKKKAQKKANDDLLEMLTKKAMEDSIINGKY